MKYFTIKLIGLILPIFFVASCKDKEDLSIDPDFSINLATPKKNWPHLKKISEGEKNALKKYGRPDFVRIWWNKKGRILTAKELGDSFKKNKISELHKSWIYLEPPSEIIFYLDGSFKETKLCDKLKIIGDYGDPEDIKTSSDTTGSKCEIWTYYSAGYHFKFIDDNLVSTQEFTPMGKFMKK